MKRMLAGLALLSAMLPAHAGIITADFRTEADLGDYATSGAKVYQHLNASIGEGVELDEIEPLLNPGKWIGGQVWMDLDPLTNILTLSARDGLDFQTFLATLGNITGDSITGIRLLSNTLTVQAIHPLLSFSDSGVSIFYGTSATFNLAGSASFQLQLKSSEVPEPGSLALVGLAGGLLGLARRRRRA